MPVVPVWFGWVVEDVTGAVVVGIVEDCWVHPAMTRPAVTQSPRTRIIINPDFMIEIDQRFLCMH
jgi:hypothetical protein